MLAEKLSFSLSAPLPDSVEHYKEGHAMKNLEDTYREAAAEDDPLFEATASDGLGNETWSCKFKKVRAMQSIQDYVPITQAKNKLRETIDVLADEAARAHLEKSRQDVKEGRLVDMEEVF